MNDTSPSQLKVNHGTTTHTYGEDCEICQKVFENNLYVQRIKVAERRAVAIKIATECYDGDDLVGKPVYRVSQEFLDSLATLTKEAESVER